MAFRPEFTEGEEVEHTIDLKIGKKHHLHLVLTNYAAYWPVKKMIALTDPIGTAKVELSEIQEVSIGKKSSALSAIAGVLLTLLGFVWTFAGYPEVITFGVPQGFIVGGTLLAIFGGRRMTICIKAKNVKLKWSTPVAFGRKVKKKIRNTALIMGKWSKNHSLNISLKMS